MSRQQRPPRAVGLANGAVALVILVVVVAFGVAVSQSPPPAIAAFAPEVRQHANQKSLAGAAGPGALGASAPTGVPATPMPTPSRGSAAGATPTPNLLAGRPAQVRCYGSPPHQTEDPQSPPCRQSFDGDNGGVTYRGVTRDTITVGWPFLWDGFPPPDNETIMNALVGYMNSHFQLYGRKLVLVKTDITGGAYGHAKAQEQVADADKAAAKGIFASLGYSPEGGTSFYYNNRLAQDGVLSVSSAPLLQTEAQLAATPYTWTTVPGYDKVEANLGNLWCHQLKAGQPQYAGPPTPPAQSWGQRRIAVYYETTTNSLPIDPQPLVSTLNACGEQVSAHALNNTDGENTSAVNDMQQHGVTTVACLCSSRQYGGLMNAAANQAYFPEWLVSNEQFLSYDAGPQQDFPTQQRSHVIGIDFNNEMLDPQNEFWYRAVKEMVPGYAYQQNSQNVYGYYRYEELLLLAAGIQQAGPTLTPQTFQQGLYDTRFSNVGHGAAPYYQASVGFGPGDHSFYDDAAAIWWNSAATSYTTNQGNPGAYCYSHLGDRSSDWSQPRPAFYSGQCRGG
jgi:hypothetical protein